MKATANLLREPHNGGLQPINILGSKIVIPKFNV
jgi:hypothetical protein